MFDDFDDEDEYEGAGQPEKSPSSQAFLPPRKTSSLLGHQLQENLLLSLYAQQKLPHALLLAGVKGIGKSVFAFRLARFLLKYGAHEQGEDNQAGLFGEPLASSPLIPSTMDISADDPIFLRVASGGHPDLLVVERKQDEKKQTQKDIIDVETVRGIAPFFRMTASTAGGWRIVIIDDCESMNRNAQNALLKILEEPPPRAVLILVCHRLGAMIPTIRSRCRVLNFRPPAPDVLQTLIAQGTGLSGTQLSLLADLSNGSLGHALTLHEQGVLTFFSTFLSQLSHWPKFSWLDVHGISAVTGGMGGEAEYKVMEHVILWFAERLVIAKAVGTHTLPPVLWEHSPLMAMLDHYSLEEWVQICDKLKDHFRQIDTGNLDRRLGALGAFSTLAG